MTRRLQQIAIPGPRAASSMFFALMGFISAGWIARIPAATSKLNLDTAQLGLLLLFIAVGSLISFQFIGRWVEQYGSGRATFAFSLLFIAAYVLMALSPIPAVLGLGLFVYGFGFGATDVAMNAQGVAVERHLRKSIMGSLHGYFSLGALAGAALSSGFAQAGIGLEANLLSFAVAGAVAAVWANRGQIADEPVATSTTKRSRFALPPRALWALGVVAFCGALGEGSMADWGALYIHDDLGGSEGMAAFAFTIFSTTMLAGRFATDRVANRFDPAQVVRVGSIVAAAGLASGLLLSNLIAALVGYAVMGLGLACIFPLVYSAAGSTPGIPSGRGVAAVATMGYTGFLAGPPLLGLVARVTSLQISLLIVTALIAVIPFFASSLTRRRDTEPSQDPETVS